MHRGKVVDFDGIDGQLIKSLSDSDAYKYLGILELDDIKHTLMISRLKKEYLRRLKVLLNSQFNARNMVLAINAFVLPIVRYSASVINWSISELQSLDRRTRKQFTMSRAVHPRADVDRLYIPRYHGGRGLKSVEDVVKEEQCAVYQYLAHSEDPWLQTVFNSHLIKSPNYNNAFHLQSAAIEQRWSHYVDKPLHGHYFRTCHQFADFQETFHWLAYGGFTLETEGFLTTLQDQAITARAVQHIYNSSLSPLCQLCGQHNETVQHLLSGCPVLAGGAYKALMTR